MIGRKLKNRHTGVIKEVAEYSFTGYVTFTDGSDGDIHYDSNPFKQDGKDWQYCDDFSSEKSFNQENIDLLIKGKAAIRFSEYGEMENCDFYEHLHYILKEAGISDFSTGYKWKYIYIQDSCVHTCDSASEIPRSCTKRIDYFDFYQAAIGNYSIY